MKDEQRIRALKTGFALASALYPVNHRPSHIRVTEWMLRTASGESKYPDSVLAARSLLGDLNSMLEGCDGNLS